MSQNLISATLSSEDAASVQQDLSNVKSRLSFLLSMDSGEVSSLLKVGNTFLPLLELAKETVDAHPEILPGVFDKSEFYKDYELLKAIRPILGQINELAESIQKTYMAVGSDTFVAALEVYDAVKQHKDKVPGLASTASDMAAFFKKSRSKAQSAE